MAYHGKLKPGKVKLWIRGDYCMFLLRMQNNEATLKINRQFLIYLKTPNLWLTNSTPRNLPREVTIHVDKKLKKKECS